MNVTINYEEISKYVCCKCKQHLADGEASWNAYCSKCASACGVKTSPLVVPLLIKLAWNAVVRAGVEAEKASQAEKSARTSE